MPKVLTKTQLRLRGLFNAWRIALKSQDSPQVFVVYSPAVHGLSSQSPKWQVVIPGKRTDPSAHWQDNGCKTFGVYYSVTPERREDARLKAIAWATEEYGITEWERSAFGSWHPKGTLERARAREEG